MAQDTQKLRELLSQYIGDVYAEALQYTNDPAAAKEVTRRVMTLLKRSQEAGLAVNPSMARRLTEDCCREREYYENRRATFVNGTIADMPDFDTALSEISPAVTTGCFGRLCHIATFVNRRCYRQSVLPDRSFQQLPSSYCPCRR